MSIGTIKGAVRGQFQIEAHHEDTQGREIPGSRRVLAPMQNNLITDGGLDMIATGNSSAHGIVQYCRVGAGSSDPEFSDSGLDEQLASKTGTSATNASLSNGSRRTIRYVFAQGAAQGNLAEIGFGPTASGALFSRALIKDSEGNPTTITVTDIDILTVTYVFTLYADAVDRVGEVVIGSTTHTTTTRNKRASWQSAAERLLQSGAVGGGYRVTAYTGGLTDPYTSSSPSGAVGTTMSKAWGGYVPGTHQADVTWTFPVNAANSDAIQVIADHETSGAPCPIALQTRFDPPLSKNNTQELSITWTISWGRA